MNNFVNVPNPFSASNEFKALRQEKLGVKPALSTAAKPFSQNEVKQPSNPAPGIQTPNPFVNPNAFIAVKTGQPPLGVEISQTAQAPNQPMNVQAGALPAAAVQQLQAIPNGRPVAFTKSRDKDTPNPFIYPEDFAQQKKLTAQIAATHPQAEVSQETKILDASNAPADADPLANPAPPVPEKAGNPFFNPEVFKSFRQKAAGEWGAVMEAVKDIAVIEVALELGGFGGQDGIADKFKIKGDNVQLTGQQWYNYNADVGGHGAVSMVQEFEGIERQDEAIRWLAARFKGRINLDSIKAKAHGADVVREKPVFEAPENAPHFLNDVRNYLHKERGIAKDLIERLIAEGRVYADPHKNVVMISKNGQLAELRGVEGYKDRHTGLWKSTKMLKPGSDKNSGAFMVPPDKEKVKNKEIKSEKALAVVEAGIDAMSYHMLFPSRAVTSASGASFSYPRRLMFEAFENGFSFHCAFDADSAGDKASQNIFNSALVYQVLKEQYPDVIKNSKDMLNLFKMKAVRLKLRPELASYEKGSVDLEDDEDTLDEGLMENVLFFNSENPFEHPDQPPMVKYQIKSNKFGLKQGHFEILVTPEMYRKVKDTFKLHRERPTNAKDWNELVKPKTNSLPKFS